MGHRQAIGLQLLATLPPHFSQSHTVEQRLKTLADATQAPLCRNRVDLLEHFSESVVGQVWNVDS